MIKPPHVNKFILRGFVVSFRTRPVHGTLSRPARTCCPVRRMRRGSRARPSSATSLICRCKRAGGGYLAGWQGKPTTRFVGWAVGARMTEELVIKAFRKAVEAGGVKAEAIVHTDRGSQSVSDNFRALPTDYKCRQSMSRRANCYGRRAGGGLLLPVQGGVVGRRRVRGCKPGRGRDLQLRRRLLQAGAAAFSLSIQDAG
jgi:hypothetical protein